MALNITTLIISLQCSSIPMDHQLTPDSFQLLTIMLNMWGDDTVYCCIGNLTVLHDYFQQATKFQVPEWAVGAPLLHGLQAVRVPLLHPHLRTTWKLPLLPHQGSGTVDVETAQVLWPTQLCSRWRESSQGQSLRRLLNDSRCPKAMINSCTYIFFFFF